MSGTTALFVAVPQVTPVVRRAGGSTGPRVLHRQQPPHVTVLWPFLPPPQLDEATCHRLATMFAAMPAFRARFGRVGHFPGVTYLAPEDPTPFVELTRQVVAGWPQCPPYEGAYDDIVPHVTLRWASELEAGTTLDDLLPVDVTVDSVHLAIDRRWRGWTTVRSFPLSSS